MGVYYLVIVKCVKCGKEFQIDDKEELSDFRCPCGGEVSVKVVRRRKGFRQKKRVNINKLIKCPDCGQEVSSKATECPNCGRPTERGVDGIWLVIAFIFPFVGILAGTYFAVKERSGAVGVIIVSTLTLGIYCLLGYFLGINLIQSALRLF